MFLNYAAKRYWGSVGFIGFVLLPVAFADADDCSSDFLYFGSLR